MWEEGGELQVGIPQYGLCLKDCHINTHCDPWVTGQWACHHLLPFFTCNKYYWIFLLWPVQLKKKKTTKPKTNKTRNQPLIIFTSFTKLSTSSGKCHIYSAIAHKTLTTRPLYQHRSCSAVSSPLNLDIFIWRHSIRRLQKQRKCNMWLSCRREYTCRGRTWLWSPVPNQRDCCSTCWTSENLTQGNGLSAICSSPDCFHLSRSDF